MVLKIVQECRVSFIKIKLHFILIINIQIIILTNAYVPNFLHMLLRKFSCYLHVRVLNKLRSIIEFQSTHLNIPKAVKLAVSSTIRPRMKRQLHIRRHKMDENSDHLKGVTVAIANTTIVGVMQTLTKSISLF